MRVADYIAEQLVQLGIRHVFGVGGANIEDTFAAIQRRRPAIRAVLNKHEHAAGTAADAYARITQSLGVVLVTSGGGAMNLVHALAEARASRVPMLAIVGEPPSELQGLGAFQDTSGRGGAVDAAAVFAAVSTFCARVEAVNDIPQLLSTALSAAFGERPGPAVLLIAKDRQTADLTTAMRDAPAVSAAGARAPEPQLVREAAAMLTAAPVVIIAGDQVARCSAQRELAALAEALDAPVAVTPDARDAFDNRAPRFIGVSGAMGTPNVVAAISSAHTCLLVGTRLPLLARQGLEATLATTTLVSLGRGQPFVTAARALHIDAELRQGLGALRAVLAATHTTNAFSESARLPEQPAMDLDKPALDSRTALALIERALPAGGVVIVDAGNTGATAVHDVRAPAAGHWLIAMGMAGMGYSFGAAVGAACATGKRCTVLAGDGAFFMNGLDIHTAIEHALPITYVIFNNRAHGMCLVRERLLLHDNAGYNSFRRSHLATGLGAMFPGLLACDCSTPLALAKALDRAAQQTGPAVIGIELANVEVPPFVAFQKAVHEGVTTVSRGVEHDSD